MRINEIISNKIEHDFVECDKCGCLLKKEIAIRGESRIVKPLSRIMYGYIVQCGEEKIEEVYYCKIHAPVAKTKKTNKK